MKPMLIICLACTLLALVGLTLAGPLDPPPGTISPTGRTLDEIETGTPIGSATTPGNPSAWFVIDEPGVYFLTNSLVMQHGDERDAIRIDASGVTIDCRGFRIVGTPSSGGAIVTSPDGTSRSDLTLRNGIIEGFRVAFNQDEGGRARLENMTARACASGFNCGFNSRAMGCAVSSIATTARGGGTPFGFSLGSSSIARDCTVQQSPGANAFEASTDCVLDRCSASTAGAAFIISARTRLTDCGASFCNSGFVINGSGATLTRCAANGTQGIGFSTFAGIGNVIPPATSVRLVDCISSNGTDDAFQLRAPGGILLRCIAERTTGSESDGFSITASGVTLLDCVARENDRSGFTFQDAGSRLRGVRLEGCIAELNGAIGFNLWRPGSPDSTSGRTATLIRCTATLNGQHSVSGINADGFRCEHAAIKECHAIENEGSGFLLFACDASESSASLNAIDGFNDEHDSTRGEFGTYRACAARENSGAGFLVGRSRVIECESTDNSLGFSLRGGAFADRCSARENFGPGFLVVDATFDVLEARVQRSIAASNTGGNFVNQSNRPDEEVIATVVPTYNAQFPEPTPFSNFSEDPMRQ